MKKECEGAEYFSTQPGAVSEEQVPELHSISSIGQSLIYDLLDEEYHVYADRSEATDRELREIAQALFENQGVLHRQRSNATDPIDKIHTLLTLGYKEAAEVLQLSASNLRVLVSRLRARISRAGIETVTVQKDSIIGRQQILGGLSVDYSVAAFSSQRYFAVDPVDLQWQDSALCVQTDPEMFYPEKGDSTREAKRVCQSCEVRKQCLEHALKNDEHFGIWGGKTPGERKRLKRRP